MADYEDVYAPDLAEETTSTLSGTEQFVMFDSVEGKRGSVNNVGSYILQNGDADGEGHTVAEMIEAAVPRMTKEVTGNPITVDDALGGVDSLTVDLEPVQDLHGYDKPWAPGANKNIINVENPMVFTETKEVVFDEPIPSGETVYIYKESYEYTTEPSAGPKYPVVVFYNGSTAIANVWLNPDGTKSYKLLPDQVTKVVFFSNGWNYSTSSGVEVTVNDLVFSLTEENSYTPYSNVCPISGHDSVTITDTDGTSTNTTTVTLPSTVYGGTVGVTSGTGTSTWMIVDMGDIGWSYNANYGFITTKYAGVIKDAPAFNVKGNIKSSIYPTGTYSDITGAVVDKQIGVSGGTYGYIVIRDTDYTSSASFKTAVSGQMMCFELKTPSALTSTPTEVSLYNGDNTVTADGNMDMVYVQDIVKVIEKLEG